MISQATSRGISATTAPLDSASFSVGMTTATGVTCVMPSRLKAPAQAAVLARLGWPVTHEGGAKVLVAGAVPDLAQALLRRIAQRIGRIVARREGRDAAGKRAAMGGEIHQRPRTAAGRPGRAFPVAPQAEAGLGRARRVDGHAERAPDGLGLGNRRFLRLLRPLEERGFGAGEAAPEVVEDETLQMHLADADARGEAHEIGELVDRFLEAGEPERDAWRRGADLALERGERADVADDAVEHILAAHPEEARRIGRVDRDAQLVEAGVDELA